MTREQKVALIKDRYNRLRHNPKDTKCPGVLRKIRRTINKMGETVTTEEE